MSPSPLYRVLFHQQGKVYELYAGEAGACDLPGFIEIGDIQFGERSQVLVDPSEEKLKNEFSGVKNAYIPVYSVIRIDRVNQQGPNKIHDAPPGGSVMPFPFPGNNPKEP